MKLVILTGGGEYRDYQVTAEEALDILAREDVEQAWWHTVVTVEVPWRRGGSIWAPDGAEKTDVLYHLNGEVVKNGCPSPAFAGEWLQHEPDGPQQGIVRVRYRPRFRWSR